MVLDEWSLERCGYRDASGGPPQRVHGLMRVAATQATGISKDSGASMARATGQLPGRAESEKGLRDLSGQPKQGGQAEAGVRESNATNPLGTVSSVAPPAGASSLASLMNSMPIFLLSHSSLLVLTLLTCICWLL